MGRWKGMPLLKKIASKIYISLKLKNGALMAEFLVTPRSRRNFLKNL